MWPTFIFNMVSILQCSLNPINVLVFNGINEGHFYSRFCDAKQWNIRVVQLTWLLFPCTSLTPLR